MHKRSSYSKKKTVKNNKTKSHKKRTTKRLSRKKGGGKKEYNIRLNMANIPAKRVNMLCLYCGNKKFHHRQSKLDTGSRTKEFFLGELTELFGSKTELFKCVVCGHIMWFKHGIDFTKKEV